MDLLAYSAVFLSTCILINLILLSSVESWRAWQAKQVEKAFVRLDESFIFLEKKKLFLLFSSPLVLGGAGFIILKNIFGFVIGFIIGFSIPSFLIGLAKQARIKKFQGQLVDSLVILSSCLKGGLSFVQALEALCEEMPAPAAEEFGLVLKENKLGITLDESLISLRRRMPLEEVNLLVSSILVAKVTGGELTRVFSRLVGTIRDNIKLKEKIETLTLQGKLQGVIMAILPVAFTIFIYKQDPHHFDIMLQTELGKMLLVAAVLLQLIGMYLIKRISTMKM